MLLIDKNRCVACGYCGLMCPQLTLSIHDKACIQLQPNRCTECCVCESVCEFEAIMVINDDNLKEKTIINQILGIPQQNIIFPC